MSKKIERYKQRLANSRLIKATLMGSPPITDRFHVDMLAGRLTMQLTLRGRNMYGKRVEEPSISIAPTIQYAGVTITKFSLFTKTSKMRCASFSLPAGPPKLGGTCVHSNVKKLVADPDMFICYSCYASSGNYRMANVQLSQAVRKHFVLESLKQGKLVDDLANALEVYFSRPRYGKIEFMADGKKRSQEYDVNLNYFRIHDSGDMAWAGAAYYRAWCEVAAQFPTVKFWAPTRDWPSAKWAKIMAGSRPKNFIIRPSALHYHIDAPPSLLGLDAGTSSGTARGTGADKDCPAYKVDSHSCESARCRTCWTQPQKSVAYKPHGVAPKRNPAGPPLDELLAEFGRSTARRNPHMDGDMQVFEAWMLSRGIDPSSYTEEQWFSTLSEAGMDGDDIVAHLEGSAEWQT